MPDVGQGDPGEDRDDQSKTKARIAVIAYTGLPHALAEETDAYLDGLANQNGGSAGAKEGQGRRLAGSCR